MFFCLQFGVACIHGAVFIVAKLVIEFCTHEEANPKKSLQRASYGNDKKKTEKKLRRGCILFSLITYLFFVVCRKYQNCWINISYFMHVICIFFEMKMKEKKMYPFNVMVCIFRLILLIKPRSSAQGQKKHTKFVFLFFLENVKRERK